MLNSESLADIPNPMILALKEQTLWFRFEVVHVPEGLHCGPYYMSRYSKEGMGMSTIKEARLYCTQGLVTGEKDSSSNIEGCCRWPL